MKLYLVTRKEECDWDEYNGFVVRAENVERALEVCKEFEGEWTGKHFRKENIENLEIVEVSEEGNEEVILDSFKAG